MTELARELIGIDVNRGFCALRTVGESSQGQLHRCGRDLESESDTRNIIPAPCCSISYKDKKKLLATPVAMPESWQNVPDCIIVRNHFEATKDDVGKRY